MTPRRARAGGAVVVLALAAAVLPGAGGIRSTAASWTDRTLDRATITVASDACTATGVYTGQASGALLAGSVQGVAIGAPGRLAPVSTGERTDASSLSRAVTTPASAADALASGVALTPTSTWSQTAATTGTGTSSATAGGAAPVGGVDVSGILTRSPDRSSALPGLSGVGLDVGAVSSSSSLNGCAAAWGDSGTLLRSSTVSSLGLRFSDSAVTTALSSLRTRGTDAATHLTGLSTATSTTTALAQAASDGLLAAVTQSLSSGTAAPSGASASVSVVTTPITASAAGLQTADTTTLDVASGAVVVGLPLPSGPNGDALSTARAAAIAASTATALRQRALALTTAEAGVRDAAAVGVHASVDVTVAGLKAAVVTLDATLPASTWVGTPAPALRAQVQVLGSVQANLDSTVSTALTGTLLPRVRTALASTFLTPATTAISADVTAVGALVDSTAATLGTDLAALPSVLVVTTDQRGTVAGDSWTGLAAAGNGGVTAVRVQVKDLVGTRADVFIGDTAVGPNRGAFR